MDNFKQIDVENLLNKIDKFYKSFYFNKLVKGLITSFGVVLGVFLLFDVVFYYVSIGDGLRFFLFYSLILIFISSFYFWIIIPITKLLKISNGLSEEEASKYIGAYYNEIGDSLLNVLQVSKLDESNVLTRAAFLQQSHKYKDLNFEDAVPSLNADKRIFLILIPISFFIGLLFSNAKVITEGSNRIYNYEIDYSSIAPYKFFTEDQTISIFEGSTALLKVKLEGNDIPNQLKLHIGGVEYTLAGRNGLFEFALKNVSKNTEYFYSSGNFKSDNFQILVVKRPSLKMVSAKVESLDYYLIPDNTVNNPSVLNVMEGSLVSWYMELENGNDLTFYWNDSLVPISKSDNGNIFLTEANFSGSCRVFAKDKFGDNNLIFQSDVFVQKDEFPSIRVNEVIEDGFQMFTGVISDDFGFLNLKVFISVGDSLSSKRILIEEKQLSSSFSFRLDKAKLSDDAVVWFSVKDNDVRNGYKSRSSRKFDIDVLSKEEKENATDKDGEEIKQKLKDVLKENEELSLEFKEIKKEVLNKKDLDWSDTKRIKSAVEKQEELNRELEKLNKDIKKYNSEKNLEKEPSSEMIEKQKQLEDLMEKLLSDENKEMLEELKKMMEELNKDKLQEQLNDIEKSQEDLEKELNRDLEIFKQMEVEQKMEEVLSKLDKIKKRQEDLLKENVKNENSLEENTKDQEKLNNEFEKLVEKMDELDSLNKELKDPNNLDLDKEKQEEVSKEMEEASEESKDGKRKESQDSQEDAVKKMEELQDKIEESLSMNSSNQEGEDLEALRKILENLLILSFEQESNMESIKQVDRTDPLIVELTQEQLKIQNNSEMVKDSLYALSVRIPQIESHISDELKLLDINMGNTFDELTERNLNQASLYQQKSLTSINNLAVLLDEIIQQMQEQQKKKNEGNGSCSKPGEGKPKPSLGKSKKKQEELAKQMEAMKKKMEKGKMPGKMNPGSVGEGMSMEIAKLALQQEQIRSEIRKMRDELQKQGDLNGAGELKKLEELLDKNEEDIINFNLDNEFFERQKDIEVKLLQAENASREREKEKKRESKSAKNRPQLTNTELEEYLKMKQSELELLRLSNPKFSNYYKNKVGQYNLSD